MKKLLSIVLALSLCLTAMMGCFVVSAETTIPTITVSDVSAAPGAVEITITGANFSDVCAADLVITLEEGLKFDALLKDGEELEGSLEAEDGVDYVVNGQTVRYLDLFNGFENLSTETLNLTVKATAAADGEYDVTAVIVAATIDEDFINGIVIENGVVTIKTPCTHENLTYTDNGDDHTVTCADCADYTVTEAHNYVDGKCVCGAVEVVEIEKFDFAGTNMTLGNSLALNFFVNKSDITTTGNYIEIRKTYADDTEDLVVTYPQDEWGTQGAMYRVNFTGIYAMEMCDKLYATVYNSDGQAISNVKEESIESYAYKAIANGADAMKTVAVDMLLYGAAAQKDFKYDVNNLASADLTEAQLAYATADVTIENNQVKELNVYGSNCTLKSQILLNMYFYDVTTSMYAKVSFTDFEGTEFNYTVQGSDFKASSGNYGPIIDKLYVADARQLVTVEVYNESDVLVGKCVDSVESYCARAIAGGADTNGLYTAIIKFATSSYNFLNS